RVRRGGGRGTRQDVEVARMAFEVCFFFFQAEDGIRDLIVTGVQTCALPICPNISMRLAEFHRQASVSGEAARKGSSRLTPRESRSEERRVGKEGRAGWWPDDQKQEDARAVPVESTADADGRQLTARREPSAA